MKVLGMILGIVTAIFGIMACAMPFRTFLGIGWLIGIILLICGIQMVALGLTKNARSVGRVILGIVLLFVGAALSVSGFQRFMTDLFIVYLVGASVIIYGVYQIIHCVKTMREDKWYGIFGIIVGIISIIAGAFGISHPILTMLSLGMLIGFVLIMQGINLVLISLAAGRVR